MCPTVPIWDWDSGHLQVIAAATLALLYSSLGFSHYFEYNNYIFEIVCQFILESK
jgi:hypothetical protein